MPPDIYHHTFANGLTLLFERMDHVRSAALYFLVPAGCIYDPPAHLGAASVLADLITRGAGSRDSRALTLALDGLGFGPRRKRRRHSHEVLGRHPGPQPVPALDIYADILRRPHSPKKRWKRCVPWPCRTC